jgi:hypothetical protein
MNTKILNQLVNELASSGVETLEKYYQTASELEQSGEGWFNLVII